ncbi:3-carboxy-cis,cis-muconate cycloisomerase [Gaiella sp.]|uniref:3-carboxy-cis,cis-muconate cycloisomerase n=1 Tax=Gaiella sp. TaxID=2663207 RepID=UPI002E3072D7|nr:3-carboxy-cis,cis-muconate cycloisomerase [Gaiella sp.]HEX5585200.1 3-carboxy-cis,cis-muconate cycloisomerase [Gaiella sp.]
MPSDELFAPIFVPDRVWGAVSGRAWVQAMLDAERALARAEAKVGVIPADAAETIASCCYAARFDVERLADEGRSVGNPAEPLVRALVAEAGDAGRYVHWGATSQDIVDTAAMLVARTALDEIGGEVGGAASACAELARTHRETAMTARTLLQQAVPTTFGLVAAGWLDALLDVRDRLHTVRSTCLAAQLGGAGGTLAALGADGLAVAHAFAEELGLAEPALPWHTNRVRVGELAGALDITAGALGKIALDVTLLAQTEVGEVAEGGDGGGSSAMPQKRNPVGAVLTAAAARTAHAHAAQLTGGMPQELQRATGGWQAEWTALTGALAFTGGAAASLRETVEHLRVLPERMARNLELSGGLLLAEAFAYLLAPFVGRPAAQRFVGEAVGRAEASGRSLAAELAADPHVTEHVDVATLEQTLDPRRYLGSAVELTDRALARYDVEQPGGSR